jgi:glycosyltransferase involved in cell wall biosynthesis
MGDSLEKCIDSIMDQVDSSFEVVVLDDNSSDNTRHVLNELVKSYPNLRYETLPADSKRKLGFTRNYSFEIAKGEWCIFHIDADDKIGPHLKHFTLAVETLDGAFQSDKLYAGKQVHMARRKFLLEKGPFRNIYRGEDRDLYERLVKDESWILIDHKRFIFRMERPAKKLVQKMFTDVMDQTVTDIRKTYSFAAFLKDTWRAKKRIGVKILMFKIMISPYALYKAKELGDLTPTSLSNHDFTSYREANTKSLSGWCARLGVNYPSEVNPDIYY